MDFLYLVYTFTNSPFVAGKEESILTLCWNCLFDLFFVAFVITVIHNGLPQRILPFCLTIKLYCSIDQLCPTVCDLMDCSMPGFSVLCQLLQLAQTHVH